ncbi:GGDEF domain-containing protein [Porticoccaceae bacterium LTM1]|nr:GGDEF domain-containing protein [Porticoccaceae bacterium LTM1]
MSNSRPNPNDSNDKVFAIGQLRQEELGESLPVGLLLMTLGCLGFGAWHYLVVNSLFSLILTVAGVLSLAMLLMLRLSGKRLIPQIQNAFGMLLGAMSVLFVLMCDVEQVGMLASLCMMVGFSSVLNFQRASWMAIATFAALVVVYLGWQELAEASYSNSMWLMYLGTYISVGVYLCTLEFCRRRGREKLVAVSRQFNRVAATDQLTKLPNRREMERLIGSSLNRYHLAGEAFSIVIADIDNYQHFNDRHGHQMGDKLLKMVGDTLHQMLRSNDIVARWGGDEFLILLKGQQLEAAQQVAERLRQAIGRMRLKVDDKEVSVTMSFGVSCMQGHETGDELITSADRGLYQAKHMGRDMVVAG